MSDESAANAATISYLKMWADSFSQVLAQISSPPLACVLVSEPAGELPVADNDLWIAGACSGGLRGELSLRLPAPAAVRLAQVFMSEPASPETPFSAEHGEAAAELMRQVAGLVASAVKAVWGEVQLRLELSPNAPSWPASTTAWLAVGDPAAPEAVVEVHLSAALAAALRVEKAEAPAQPADEIPSSAISGQMKLELLLNVELGITLRFGSRRLLLREILELNPGSVVDLDRQVKEPVDLLLDGRLLARGEIVVMDGNYGVRLTEIGPGVP